MNKHHYPYDQTVLFRYNNDYFGLFSNMFPTTLKVNDVSFQSSEALYQALKFPTQPSIQKAIAVARNGFNAKKVAYNTTIPIVHNWDYMKIDAMRLTLAQKVINNPRVLSLLAEVKVPYIVELSSRDQFWGAYKSYRCHIHGKGDYQGYNFLGRLWTRLRDLQNTEPPHLILTKFLEPVERSFLVDNKPFTKESVLETEKSAWSALTAQAKE